MNGRRSGRSRRRRQEWTRRRARVVLTDRGGLADHRPGLSRSAPGGAADLRHGQPFPADQRRAGRQHRAGPGGEGVLVTSAACDPVRGRARQPRRVLPSVAPARGPPAARPSRAIRSIRRACCCQLARPAPDPTRNARRSAARSPPGERRSEASSSATTSAAARGPTSDAPSAGPGVTRIAGTRARSWPRSVARPSASSAPRPRSTDSRGPASTGGASGRPACAARRTPTRHVEGEGREIGRGDGRGAMRRQVRVFLLAQAPHRQARAQACGAAVARWTHESRDADTVTRPVISRAVSRRGSRLRQASTTTRTPGTVSEDSARPSWRRPRADAIFAAGAARARHRAVLRRRVEPAVQRKDLGGLAEPGGQQAHHLLDLAHSRQEHQGVVAARANLVGGHRRDVLEEPVGHPARVEPGRGRRCVADLQGVQDGRDVDDRGGGVPVTGAPPSRRAKRSASPSRTSPPPAGPRAAGAARTAGRRRGRTHIASMADLIEHHRAHAQVGIGDQSAHQHARCHELHPRVTADRRVPAHRQPTGPPGSVPVRRARRRAADRAATRRGCVTTTLPATPSATATAGGTSVLPVLRGAWTTAVPVAARASRSAGSVGERQPADPLRVEPAHPGSGRFSLRRARLGASG